MAHPDFDEHDPNTAHPAFDEHDLIKQTLFYST